MSLDELIEIQAFPSNRSYFSLGWQLTNICNFNCHYCHPYNKSGSHRYPDHTTSIQIVEDFSRKFSALNKLIYWQLVGGEVTAIPYFSELLKKIRTEKGLIQFTSNASKRLDWWRIHLPLVDSLNLSYHPQSIDDQHFLQVADLLDEADCHSHIHIMADPLDLERSFSMASSLKNRLKRTSLGIDMIYTFGSEGYSLGPFSYKKEDLQKIQEFAFDVPEVKKIKYHSGRALGVFSNGVQEPFYTYELANQHRHQFKGWKCQAGIDGAILSFDQKVYPSRCGVDSVGLSIDDYLKTYERRQTYICKADFCQCGPDIMYSKKKD